MQAALRARLIADTDVSAIVGTRVYWMNRPQGSALPAIRLQTISDPDVELIKGIRDLREARVQVDCMAMTYSASRALASAVIAAVRDPAEAEGVKFSRSLAERPRDLGEDTASGFVFRASVDLLVRHISA